MLARAMIRDLFSRTRAAQMLSTLMIIMAIAPIAGPLVGGQMIKMTSWHAIFWLLAIIGTDGIAAIRERNYFFTFAGPAQRWYALDNGLDNCGIYGGQRCDGADHQSHKNGPLVEEGIELVHRLVNIARNPVAM